MLKSLMDICRQRRSRPGANGSADKRRTSSSPFNSSRYSGGFEAVTPLNIRWSLHIISLSVMVRQKAGSLHQVCSDNHTRNSIIL